MSKLNLTPDEEQKVVEILERYLPELESETVHTDNMERKAFMQDLLRRLKS